jgi:hypothetical protein
MGIVRRIRTLSLTFAIVLGAILFSTMPAAAGAQGHIASNAAAAQTSGCQNTAYDPFVDYRPVNGVMTKVVVGRVRIDCSAPTRSYGVRLTLQKTGSASVLFSTASPSLSTSFEMERWYQYSPGEWRTIGESGAALPRFSYSNKVQL